MAAISVALEVSLPVPRSSSSLKKRSVLVATALSLAAGMSLSVFAALLPRFPGDLPVAQWVQSLATSWLDTGMEAVTLLGKTYVAGATILVAAVVFALARRWPQAAAFLGVGVMEAVVQAMKYLIDRPRPPEELLRVMESGSRGSFPSGHVYHAVVFGGLLMALVIPGIRPKWLRRALMALVLLLVPVIAVSRVYLGAHWPSDVLGSVALGIPSVVLLLYLCRRLGGGESPSRESGPQQ